MQYKVSNIKILANEDQNLDCYIKKNLHLKSYSYRISSRSIDARKKDAVYLVYELLITTTEPLKGKFIVPYESSIGDLDYPLWCDEYQPVVIGFGPAGIFASLYLARCGAKPIIIERGSAIDKRVQEVDSFLNTRKLNKNCNIQFGEGGAGAFSDGKLTTNVKNPYNQFILSEFVKHGAPEDILYDKMPHIGTDVLRQVIKSIRLEIESLGGSFYFDTTFEDLIKTESAVIVKAGLHQFRTNYVLLGIGHSAKDTIRHLYYQNHIQMEPKAFSMGVRVEHLASKIDEAQYGSFASYLPRAYYKLSHHDNGRGIYTFCMCPGGYVMASSSDEEAIVTNGMSNRAREGINSNSAILVDVRPSDYGNGPLDGLAYQEHYEHLAYLAGHKTYQAPANLMAEFLNNQIAHAERSIHTTYPHGIHFCDLKECLPDFVVDSIKKGIEQFSKKLRGFDDPDAILIGIESRSSSPVRIVRDENRKSNVPYLYPIGEGAGYAGGIMSAALDGLQTAIIINQKNR